MMFRIRKEQIAALVRPDLDRLKARALIELETNYPVAIENKTKSQIDKELEMSLQDAQQLGLCEDSNISAYLVLCCRFKTNLHGLMARQDVAAILNNSSLLETEKIYLIEENIGQLYHERI